MTKEPKEGARPTRAPSGTFDSKTGESYIGNLLAITDDPYNRERLLYTWPNSRGQAYDEIGARTGFSRTTLSDYASIVYKLATDFTKRPDKFGKLDAFDPTLLEKLEHSSLDTAREIDALCKLATYPNEMKAIRRLLDSGKPVSAVARRKELNTRRAACADRQEEIGKEVRTWPLPDQERFLAVVVADMMRGDAQPEEFCEADVSISQSIAERTLREIEQQGGKRSDMLRDRDKALEELECKYRDMRLVNAEQLDAEMKIPKRVRRFRQHLQMIGEGRSNWIPGDDLELLGGKTASFKCVAEGFGFFERSIRLRRNERKDASSTVYAEGEHGEVARLKELLQAVLKQNADLRDDLKGERELRLKAAAEPCDMESVR